MRRGHIPRPAAPLSSRLAHIRLSTPRLIVRLSICVLFLLVLLYTPLSFVLFCTSDTYTSYSTVEAAKKLLVNTLGRVSHPSPPAPPIPASKRLQQALSEMDLSLDKLVSEQLSVPRDTFYSTVEQLPTNVSYDLREVVDPISEELPAGAEPPWMPGIPPHLLVNTDPELAGIKVLLERVAPTRQVVVGMVTNSWYFPGGHCDRWLTGLRRAGVTNYVVIGMDEEVVPKLRRDGVNSWGFRTVAKFDGKIGKVRVGGSKFRLVLTILALGWDVLLSDLDVIFFRDPFESIPDGYDLAGQSNGWDAKSGAGVLRLQDNFARGWASRVPPSFSHSTLNFGLLYMRANVRNIDLYNRMHEALMNNPKVWDQSLFNQWLYFAAYRQKLPPPVSAWILPWYEFMNSRGLYRHLRHAEGFLTDFPRPVLLHSSAHPDKPQRLKAAFAHFWEGDSQLLLGMRDGHIPSANVKDKLLESKRLECQRTEKETCANRLLVKA